jgi:addiction module HigA family antidote
MYAFKPDYSIHPGEYLENVLSAREIKKNDLSLRLGNSVKHLSQILNKQASISSELALHLERALGISANIWNHMNADYNLFEARQNEQKLLREKIQWLKKFPIKDLIKNNFLPNVKNFETQIEKLNGTKTDDEMEANKYSENILIPEADFKKFSKNKIFSKNLILNFAREIEVHPGIVVGRLQYNKLLHLNKFNK